MKQAFRPTRTNRQPRQQGQPGQQAQSGFSLIELMVVIVIIGIIAAFAVPSYQKSVRRAERTDARAMLLYLQSLQERYYFNKNQYGNLTQLTGSATHSSPDGHYTGTITLENSSQTYKLHATRAKATLDTDCNEFILHSNGTKEAEDDGNNAATEDCWGR